jgi:hypothetical protein
MAPHLEYQVGIVKGQEVEGTRHETGGFRSAGYKETTTLLQSDTLGIYEEVEDNLGKPCGDRHHPYRPKLRP